MQEHDALVELARPTDRRRVVVAIKPVGPCQHHVGLRQLEKAYLERRQRKAIEFAAHRVIRPVKLRREVGGGDVILLEPDQLLNRWWQTGEVERDSPQQGLPVCRPGE